MPAPVPHEYSARITRTLSSRVRIELPTSCTRSPARPLDDNPSSWSPEMLVLSALGIGMLTTFEAFAARDRIALLDWAATVKGNVEQTPDGVMFTSIVLSVDVEIAGNVERIATTLEDAKQACLVINSLRVPVVIETEIRTSDGIRIELPCALPLAGERQALAS